MSSKSRGAMVHAFSSGFDAELKQIQEALGEAAEEAPQILMRALNSAANKARKDLIREAQERYSATKVDISTKSLAIRRAVGSRTSVRLSAVGGMQELTDYTVSPTVPLRGKNRPDSYAAKVLAASSLKSLSSRPKAFITKFRSGHVAIVQRVPGSRMRSNPQKEKLKKLLSPSIAHVYDNAGAERISREIIEKYMPEAVGKAIQRALRRAK